uniref:Uncharacterized protein n=1 Tax=Colobus angolensis palliatus TaxID=336983 RepID=A0A2K5I553_COLAP
MYRNQFTAWYQRMSVVYGIDTWSLVGSVLCTEDGSTSGVPSELSEPPKGFYVETIVTYKEDFVPITEKILNNWKSWTGGPGAEP